MMSEKEIHDICMKYNIENYSINTDGSIDVNDDVNIYKRGLSKIPLKFNKVSGYFNCSNNNLTTLEGCPKKVDGFFDCSNNKLVSLDGIPEYIRGSLMCYRNPLKSLEGFNDDDFNYLHCDNKDRLVLKHKRSKKLKILDIL